MSIWLAFLRKYQYYGVGMKANVWEFSGLEVGEELDKEAERIKEVMGEELELFGRREDLIEGKEKELEDMVLEQPFKAQWGAYAPMGASAGVPAADTRIDGERVEESRESR